ncbi:MAG: hypothetical protein IJF88_02425 [Oscillospiraceae bacterium]|nr:hypothetical protein [Oscillospiraceae bacterium]MBQ2633421.1 hypothetical protein [Oscillospiraceae bacterium]MBQ6121428.1 hypothetical protein [Clostridia bacterium]
MASYATVADVQARMTRDLSLDEKTVCAVLLEDAAVMIDAAAPNATPDARKIVSCRMVIRALGDGSASGVPMGATQGSMSGLGYSQSWTIGSGGGAGELYLGKADRQLLGAGNAIGSYSPTQELVPEADA